MRSECALSGRSLIHAQGVVKELDDAARVVDDAQERWAGVKYENGVCRGARQCASGEERSLTVCDYSKTRMGVCKYRAETWFW